MGLFSRKKSQSADLKTAAKAISEAKEKAPETLTKEEKKLIAARMAEIKSSNKNNATVQNSIPYMNIFKDGICQVSENHFSMTVQFFDTNYSLADFEEQNAIFARYCMMLNSFDSSITFQLTFENQNRSMQKLIDVVQI